MKKILLFVALTVSSLSLVNAQEKGGFNLGAGLAGSLPLGNFKPFASFGVGVEAQASFGITDNFAAFAQVGYDNFFAKSTTVSGITIKGSAIGLIPALVGPRFHISGFMVGAGVGYGKFTGGATGGGFTYSPQIGYSIAGLDIIGHYTAVSNTGGSLPFAGIKLIYNFIRK